MARRVMSWAEFTTLEKGDHVYVLYGGVVGQMKVMRVPGDLYDKVLLGNIPEGAYFCTDAPLEVDFASGLLRESYPEDLGVIGSPDGTKTPIETHDLHPPSFWQEA